MPDERDERNDIIEPDDRPADRKQAIDPAAPLDPNDVIPVPVAMEPAEIDERAQVVEALRTGKSRENRDDDSRIEPDRH